MARVAIAVAARTCSKDMEARVATIVPKTPMEDDAPPTPAVAAAIAADAASDVPAAALAIIPVDAKAKDEMALVAALVAIPRYTKLQKIAGIGNNNNKPGVR